MIIVNQSSHVLTINGENLGPEHEMGYRKLGSMLYVARCPECNKYIYGHYDSDLIGALPTICPECKAFIGKGG